MSIDFRDIFIFNNIEASIFGYMVYDINYKSLRDINYMNIFNNMENNIINNSNDIYICAKIPASDITMINFLELHGYTYIETQFEITARLKPSKIDTMGFILKEVTELSELQIVLEIASTTFKVDRISVDPQLSPNLSSLRYTEFVKNSFFDAQQRVMGLINIHENKIVAFKTHKIEDKDKIRFLLGGVANEEKNKGYGYILNVLETEYLLRKGYKVGIGHVSSINIQALSIDLKVFGYKINNIFIVLRKIVNNK